MLRGGLRFLHVLLVLGFCVMATAQKPRATAPKKQTTTQKAKTRKSQPSQKAKSSQKTQKPQSQKPATKAQLQAQQKKLKANIAANQRQKAEIEKKVKQRLQDVLILGNAIDEKQRTVDTIKTDIASLDSTIRLLNGKLDTLRAELAERQQRYAKSVRYMYHNRKTQSQLLFILSAKTVNQIYRRTRFVGEYATYQKAQGEAVMQKQEQLNEMLDEIAEKKTQKSTLLAKGEEERKNLEEKQAEQQKVARQLQKEQATVQKLIQQQLKEEEELNARIDKLIAEEIAREKARIEAEKRRKAEEQARKERERKERERQLAEAKAREEKARQEARAARTAQEKAKAEKRAKTAEKERKTAEQRLAEQRKKSAEKPKTTEADPDRQLSGSFASNKGRLPMPITGNYQVVRSFGSNVVEGAGKGVHLSSKGIWLKGEPGAQARCIFDGEVSKIYSTGTSFIVMVRHGRFISVYCDLASVSVKTGQKVSTNQRLGPLGPTGIMQFQLRNWTNLLNPRSWFRR